jgi:hypothetical protein
MAETLSVTELLERYREAARQSATLDENEASRWAYQAHTFFKTLRETEVGRNGVSALMADTDPQVRRWAATHSLTWDRERAREVLRSLEGGA